MPFLVLGVLGFTLACLLAPGETDDVADHLTGFPDSNAMTHLLRPSVLSALCFVPALGAFYYGLVRELDRYLIRRFMSAFLLCFLSLYAIWLISDLSGNVGDFRKGENVFGLMATYYLVAFPKVFVEFAPFALLLAMLYSLGKMSRGQEIVSMIQTGRGVARLILPLAVIGFLMGLICLGFNYRWAPAAVSYQKALLEQAEEGSMSQARNVVYPEIEQQRLWFVGSFPYEYFRGEALENVIIRSFTDDRKPEWRLEAETAEWDREKGDWKFSGVTWLDLTARSEIPNMPESNWPISPEWVKDVEDPLVMKRWPETPWQLIKPGLKADQLGIPGLYGWLVENEKLDWVNKRQFLTQWHYRWAQPWICLAIVLLAAPLGIVFTRRGAAGGIALAIFLCAGLMFTSTVFLALGESGIIGPIWAAWGTNLLAAAVALFLIQRRMVGRPIYQTIRKFLPF